MSEKEKGTNYPEKLTSGYYRVKKNWTDEEQLGQFRILAKAKEMADKNPGTFVFSNDGEIVYPEPVAEEDNTNAEVAVKADEETCSEVEVKEEAATSDSTTEPTTPIAYAKLKTLMNIRKEPSLSGEKVTVYKKNTICEVYEILDTGWLRIACPEAETGFAYVSNEGGAFAHIGKSLYTVRSGDTLFLIAKKLLGAGQKSGEIKAVNGMTDNIIRVGQVLLIP